MLKHRLNIKLMKQDFTPSLAITYILTVLKYQTGMHSQSSFLFLRQNWSKASTVLCIHVF